MSHLIRQMGYLALATPDPELSARDLSEIVGPRIVGRNGATVTLSCNSRRVEIGYLRSEKKAALALGMEAMDAAAVDEARRRAVEAGCRILSDRPYFDGVERAVRFVTPFGPIFEIHTPVPRDQPERYEGTGARPTRLEHVNLRVPDTKGFGGFCQAALGMKLSDRTTDDELMWFRAADGYHHTIAIGRGELKLHHYGFDARALQDIAKVADTLAGKGRALLWGPGRHGAGDNIFSYYADPNGCVVETSIEMERIDNDALHRPRTWSLGPESNVRNLWGPDSGPAYGAGGVPFATEA